MAERGLIPVILVGGAMALLLASLFTLDAREVGVVTSFGATSRVVTEPGLYWKAPWPLQEVVRFDARSHLLSVKATELLTRDKKNLVVEAFALWRVKDPQRFLEAVGSNESAEAQLGDIVASRVAGALGQREFNDLLAMRDTPLALIAPSIQQDIAQLAALRLGVEVQDVKVRHLGLPLQNEQSIYERMRAERLKTANAYRSEGEEMAAGIRARADRESKEILAKADEEAAGILATAEEEASRTTAAAWKEDPAFFRYLSTLDLQARLLPDGTTLILDGDSTYFQTLTEVPR